MPADDPSPGGRFHLAPREFAGLVSFLRDCPGRLSAAWVPFPAVSDDLLRRLRRALPEIPFTVVDGDPTSLDPVVLAAKRDDAVRGRHAVFVVPVYAGSKRLSDETAKEWFEALNFQREALAAGPGRTLFLLDEAGLGWMLNVADDLSSWIRTFDFTDATLFAGDPPAAMLPELRAADRTDNTAAVDARRFAIMENQARRAMESGLDPLTTAETYVLPFAAAAVARGELRRAESALSAISKRLESVASAHIETDQTRLAFVQHSCHALTGDIHAAWGDVAAALAAYIEGMDIAARLAAADPDNARWQHQLSLSHNRIGDIHAARGDLVAARASYTEGMTIAARLAASAPDNPVWQRDLSVSHDRVGGMQTARGDLAAALDSYTDAMDIRSRLAASDPDNPGWQRDLFVSHTKIGDMQAALGDLAAALASYTDAMNIAVRLAQYDPDNAGWQRNLSVIYDRIGDMQAAQGDLNTSVASYTHAMNIAARLTASDPANADWQRGLWVSKNKIGQMQAAWGDLPAALASYTEAMDMATRLAASNPDNTGWQRDLSISHNRIGDMQAALGDIAAALASYTHGMDIAARLATFGPDYAEWQRDFWVSHAKLAEIAEKQDNPNEAASRWRNVHDILSSMKRRGMHLSPEDERFFQWVTGKLGV